MICYHATTQSRLASILEHGLLPNADPTWFDEPTPYVMLSEKPWVDLNGAETVVLEVSDPQIRKEYFDEPEGLRWPYRIAPEHVNEIHD